jgi:hypothetical protein
MPLALTDFTPSEARLLFFISPQNKRNEPAASLVGLNMK